METLHEEDPVKAGQDQQTGNESLPQAVARQVEVEAIQQSAASSGAAIEHYRRGRVEAETHRLSEEMTRQAQERQRLSHHQADDSSVQLTGKVPDATEREPKPAPWTSFGGAETLPAPNPLRRVLIPLRGSSYDERTLPYARALATELATHISLGNVRRGSGNRLQASLIAPGDSQWQDLPQVSSYSQRLAEQSALVAGQVDSWQIIAPSVVEGLLELESLCKADLVLVALRSHSSANHLSLGNVVDSLVRKGSIPVMVIPPQARADGHPFTVHHILVPLDGSALSEQALAPLLGWLGQVRRDSESRLAVTLLGVAENEVTLGQYQSYLDSLRSALLGRPECTGIQIQAEAMIGSPPGAIVGAVTQNIFSPAFRSEPTDLVIMATHGRGGMGRWLLGSVADHVLPRVQVPVLLVHPAYLNF